MKKIFYLAVVLLVLFEIANVFFIMPMPGSQRMTSIDLAYFLYTARWYVRLAVGLLAAIAFFRANWSDRRIPLAALGQWAVIVYLFNFQMSADHMFYQPSRLLMKTAAENKVDSNRLVIGIALNGAAKAYPIQFMGYHHQAIDTLAGQPIMVTYCTVCRTGRVFAPVVAGKPERFRLVGMDHFNAMFEDASTGSWWRQATGEAIAGKLKGSDLPELNSAQMTLSEWLALYPNSLIMQPDPKFSEAYDHMKNYESGRGKSELTRTDSLSWKDKSWVVGIKIGKASKAFDWNRLKKERIIQDKIGATPIVLALAQDDKSFAAFERPAGVQTFTIEKDTLVAGENKYLFNGKSLQTGVADLKQVNAYQEFWHSWRTFHVDTDQY